MDLSVEETKPELNLSDPVSTVLQAARRVARWLIGFFVLSKDEQSQAGIVFNGYLHED
jgi:hypothetical protein